MENKTFEEATEQLQKSEYLRLNGNISPVVTKYDFIGGSYSIEGYDFDTASDVPTLEKVDISFAIPTLNEEKKLDLKYESIQYLWGTPISTEEGIRFIKEGKMHCLENIYYNSSEIYAFILLPKIDDYPQMLYPIRFGESVKALESRESVVEESKRHLESIKAFHQRIDMPSIIKEILDEKWLTEKRRRSKREW